MNLEWKIAMGDATPNPKGPGLGLKLAVAAGAALAGLFAIYVQLGGPGNPPAPETGQAASTPAAGQPSATTALKGLNRGTMTTFVFHAAAATAPALRFKDSAGVEHTLAEWQGKVVLLNLWATWCAPCRKEMPALDRLQQGLGGDRFAVVAVATDRDIAKPRKFLADNGITGLTLYHDEGARLISAVQGIGMPTTLLFGKDGREIGRLVGPAEWDSEDAKRLIVAAIEAAR